MDKKVAKKPNHLKQNVRKILAFGQTVFGFLYAHYTNKINKQKVVNKPNRLFPNVIFVYIRTNNIGLMWAHFICTIVHILCIKLFYKL